MADYSNTLYVRLPLRVYNEGRLRCLLTFRLPCLYTAGELGRRVGPHHPLSKVRSVERARRQAKIRVQRDHRHFQVCCILHALLHRISLRADVVALSLGSSALQQHFGDLFSPVPRSAVGWSSPPRRGGPDRTYSIPACSEANAVKDVIRCVDPALMYTICVRSDTIMSTATSSCASHRCSPTFSSRPYFCSTKSDDSTAAAFEVVA